MKIKSTLQAVVLSLGLTSAANAANYTFAYSVNAGDGVGANTVNANSTPAGLSVAVTGWTTSNLTTFNQVSVGQYGSNGLGVKNGFGDSHTVDNSGNVDFLLFYFGGASVDINTVSIGYVSGDSDFKYWIGNTGNVATLFGGTGTSVNGGGGPSSYTINGSNIFGTYILIGANPNPGNTYDNFKLSGMTVSTNSNIPGVPDAGSTVALLGLALAGLAALKRRVAA